MIALFGYPEAHENDAERAVRAALAILGALDKIEVPVRLSARVGIVIEQASDQEMCDEDPTAAATK
jgi:hypothetical protein